MAAEKVLDHGECEKWYLWDKGLELPVSSELEADFGAMKFATCKLSDDPTNDLREG